MDSGARFQSAGARADKDALKKMIRDMLTEKRYRHSLNVAKRAAELARRYGEDPGRAEYAGLAHDICKTMPGEEQLEWIKQCGVRLDEITLSLPQTHHAIAGSCFLRRKLGVADQGIISAVRYHTTGRAGMTRLEEIVYLADLTSEDRSFPDLGQARALADRDLGQGMLYALEHTILKMVRARRPVCMESFEAYNYYTMRQNKNPGGRGA